MDNGTIFDIFAGKTILDGIIGNDQQIGLMKKKDSEEQLLSKDLQLPGIKLSFWVYVMHVIILDIKL
jgi:hypothetical protein